VVNYEFIRMPDSTGFGDYTESGQVIPVSYQGARPAALPISCFSMIIHPLQAGVSVGLSQEAVAAETGGRN
jgi:acetoacetate decarboxylase